MDSSQESPGDGEDAAVQWMTAGRGLLHEEMWRPGDAGRYGCWAMAMPAMQVVFFNGAFTRHGKIGKIHETLSVYNPLQYVHPGFQVIDYRL
jgi:hypothetical protein